ncbi:MAG: cupin domain-containing protein, partial [Betaproteobacteria bacterium]
YAEKVERKDVTGKVKIEAPLAGYLSELNGKYRLRVTETTFKPGGYVGEHHHIGPGIRVVAAGEVTRVHGGKTTVLKAGDAYYVAGNDASSNHNKGDVPAVVLVFEIFPADWKGSTAVPPR